MPCLLPDEISTVNDDVFSYMCNLAMEKCSKKADKKKASCGGAAMRKRLLIKNFVAQMIAQDRQSRDTTPRPPSNCSLQLDQEQDHCGNVFTMIPRLNYLDGFDANDVGAEISDEEREKRTVDDDDEEDEMLEEETDKQMTDDAKWTMMSTVGQQHQQQQCIVSDNAAENNRKRKLDTDEEMAEGEPEANYSKTCFRIIYDMDKFAFNDGVFNYVACPFG